MYCVNTYAVRGEVGSLNVKRYTITAVLIKRLVRWGQRSDSHAVLGRKFWNEMVSRALDNNKDREEHDEKEKENNT